MIKSAAIRYPNGNIYTGKYHGKCFEAAAEAGEEKDGGRVEQGFVTQTGEYLDRFQAALEAIEHDQVKEFHCPHLGLMSEDLKQNQPNLRAG